MQDNEFEKQFKKLMDDFNLPPSGAAWEEIKRKLQQKRRRKTPFIFLLVSALLGSGIFITYYLMNNKEIKNIAIVSKNTSNKPVIKNVNNLPAVKQLNPIKNSNTLSVNDTINKNEKAPQLNFKELNTTAAKVLINKEEGISNNKKNNINKNKPGEKSNAVTISENDDNNNIQNKRATADSTLIPVNNQPVISSTINNDSALIISNNQAAQTAKKDSVTTAIKSPVKINLANKNKLAKWQFGITAGLGKSNAVSGWFTESKSNAAVYANNPGLLVTRDTIPVKKIYKASAAYQISLTAQRRVIRNGFVSAGIAFTHFTIITPVSNNIDSVRSVQDPNAYFTVLGFYKPGASSFTNKFSFIEVPVFFQQELPLKKNLLLSYNAGFSLRQLVSSKSLFYNSRSNIYFSKNALLNKTQVQLMAGAAIKVNAGKATSIYIGPQLSYSLSKFSKNVYHTDFHFINYGLQAGLLLHRK